MTETKKAWNQRFVEYARVHGRSPEAQIEFDRGRYPGGVMCGYILWNEARIYEFSGVNNKAFFSWTERAGINNRLVDHKAYDEWLKTLPVGHGVEKKD